VQNSKIQLVRSLLGKSRERQLAGCFVTEGVRLVEEGLQSGWEAPLVLFTDSLSPRGRQVVEALKAAGADVEAVSDHVMHSISDTETPQGILTVFKHKELPIKGDLDFAIVADGMRDPGNLGSLMRTAKAAGTQALILTPGSVDPFSPKVLRAAMGAHFHLPMRTFEWPAIDHLLKDRVLPLQLFLAESDRGLSVWEANLRQPCALIIGGEAGGASQEAHHRANTSLKIPMPGHSESLNAAVAAAIMIFEVVRQRSFAILTDTTL
jgi:TrmH family RNA methyltransferase